MIRRTLKLKLESEFQHLHTIQWKLDEKESPLVIKFKDHDAQKVEAEIRKWMKTITKVTGQKVVQDPKLPYIRINLRESDLTMYASIYGSATVVFQGKGYEKWLKENVEKVILEYRNMESIQQQSKANYDCYICKDIDTDDMILCEECRKWIHKDCDIDNIIDTEVENGKYRCPSCSKLNIPNVNTRSTTETERNRTRRCKNKSQPKNVPAKLQNNTDQTQTLINEHEVQSVSLTITEKPTSLNNALNSPDKSLNPISESPDKTYTVESALLEDTIGVNDIAPSSELQDKESPEESKSKVATPETSTDLIDKQNSGGKGETSFLDNDRNSSDKRIKETRRATSYFLSVTEEMDNTESILSISTTIPKVTPFKDVARDKSDLYASTQSNHSSNNTLLHKDINSGKSDLSMASSFNSATSTPYSHSNKTTQKVANQVRNEIADIINSSESDPKAQLQSESSQTLNDKLKSENENLKNKVIAKQYKISELELKLFVENAKYEETIKEMKAEAKKLKDQDTDMLSHSIISADSEIKLKVLQEECDNLKFHLEEMKLANTKIQNSKLQEVARERLKYEELFNTLNSENLELVRKLKVVSEQKNSLESENIKLYCKIQQERSEVGERLNKTADASPQSGLMDIKGNMCFVIAAQHTLSNVLTLPEHSDSGRFISILKRTKNLLDGKIVDNTVVEELYNAVVENWPQYLRNDGKFKQGDVVEFLMRVLAKLDEESGELLMQIKPTLTALNVCTNTMCKAEATTSTLSELIVKTSEIPNETSLSLQQVIDSFTPAFGTRYDKKCDDCGADIEESSALQSPIQTILLHVDKVPKAGRKADIEIYTSQQVILPISYSKGHPYTVTDVIIHQGVQANNGHYITNHYNHHRKQWEQLNNEKGKFLSDEEAYMLNKQGVIYVLRAQEKVSKTPSNHDESIQIINNNNLKVNKVPKRINLTEGGSRTFYRRDIRLDQLNVMHEISKNYIQLKQSSGHPISNSAVDIEGKPQGKGKDPTLMETQPQKKDIICRYFAQGHCNFGPRCKYKHTTQNKRTTDEDLTPYSKPKPICPQYEFGRCMDYDVCKLTYNHPRRCRDMLTFGECEYGDHCNFYHPKICKNSLHYLQCTNLKCPYFHLRFTKRYIAESRRDLLYSQDNTNESIYNNKQEKGKEDRANHVRFKERYIAESRRDHVYSEGNAVKNVHSNILERGTDDSANQTNDYEQSTPFMGNSFLDEQAREMNKTGQYYHSQINPHLLINQPQVNHDQGPQMMQGPPEALHATHQPQVTYDQYPQMLQGQPDAIHSIHQQYPTYVAQEHHQRNMGYTYNQYPADLHLYPQYLRAYQGPVNAYQNTDQIPAEY